MSHLCWFFAFFCSQCGHFVLVLVIFVCLFFAPFSNCSNSSLKFTVWPWQVPPMATRGHSLARAARSMPVLHAALRLLVNWRPRPFKPPASSEFPFSALYWRLQRTFQNWRLIHHNFTDFVLFSSVSERFGLPACIKNLGYRPAPNYNGGISMDWFKPCNFKQERNNGNDETVRRNFSRQPTNEEEAWSYCLRTQTPVQ